MGRPAENFARLDKIGYASFRASFSVLNGFLFSSYFIGIY